MNESFEFQPSTENEDDDTTKVESIQAEDVNTL